MSREIDRIALPEKRKKMKIIIASASRTGTLGLYTAMKILGYTPYHMYEVVVHGGEPHMKILQQAIIAEHNRLSGIQRLQREDLDNWLADYDCLVEIPSFLGTGVLEAYANDPDVKFILTERDPDKWVKSFNSTAGHVVGMAVSFPMNIIKRFNADLSVFMYLNQLAYWGHTGGLDPSDTGSASALRHSYVNYIENAKRILPKDRTLVIRLEDGLGWEQICPFLGVPIPEERYPRGNEPEKFQAMVGEWMRLRLQGAIFKLGALVASVSGMAGYVAWRYLAAA